MHYNHYSQLEYDQQNQPLITTNNGISRSQQTQQLISGNQSNYTSNSAQVEGHYYYYDDGYEGYDSFALSVPTTNSLFQPTSSSSYTTISTSPTLGSYGRIQFPESTTYEIAENVPEVSREEIVETCENSMSRETNNVSEASPEYHYYEVYPEYDPMNMNYQHYIYNNENASPEADTQIVTYTNLPRTSCLSTNPKNINSRRRLIKCHTPKQVTPTGPSLKQCADREIRITLLNSEEWKKFHVHQNEMRVENHGKPLSTILEYSVTGLDPKKLYCVGVHLVLEHSRKHLFDANSKQWIIQKTKKEHFEPTNEIINEPKVGSQLMKSINLKNLKIYNIGVESRKKHCKTEGNRQEWLRLASKQKMIQVFLNFMYRPVVKIYEMQDNKLIEIHQKSFPETAFIIVSAYKNPAIKELKKAGNKFCRKDCSN